MTLLLLGLACTGKPDTDGAVDSGVQDTHETADTGHTQDTAPSDGDGDGTSPPTDCDDANANVYPGAAEVCNSEDDDCDGLVDDADPDIQGQGLWYADGDGDMFGSAELFACEQPSGSVSIAGDCDDTDPGAWPGAIETCDGLDQDCDGLVDDSCTTAPMGGLGAEGAQAAVTGPCVDSAWGYSLQMMDVDGDGLSDIVGIAGCGEVAELLVAPGPIPPASVPDEDALLSAPYGLGESLGNVFSAPDLDGDDRPELLAEFETYDSSQARLFRTPVLGMVPDDADLTITEASGSNYGGVKVAAIPGSTGAIVMAASWWTTDGMDSGTWIVDADETGDLTTNDLPSLGPAGSYCPMYSVPRVNDAGDMDGDGDNELFFGGGEAMDVYLGPITQSMGSREPDVQLGDIYNDHEDYTGYGGIFQASADVDGDGLDDSLVFGYDGTDTLGVARGSSDGLITMDGASPVLVCPDLDCDNVTPLDANGDGHVDLALGAPADDTAASNSGLVYLEYGPFAGTREVGGEGNAVILGDTSGQEFGYALAGGDTNGDGFDDLAVGMYHPGDETDPGSVWLFLGGP